MRLCTFLCCLAPPFNMIKLFNIAFADPALESIYFLVAHLLRDKLINCSRIEAFVVYAQKIIYRYSSNLRQVLLNKVIRYFRKAILIHGYAIVLTRKTQTFPIGQDFD